MARWNFSLCCSPKPIAKVMQVFPKLALIFLLVHIIAMIYVALHPSPNAWKSKDDKPPGVIDTKMKNIAEDMSRVMDARLPNTLKNDTKNKPWQDRDTASRNETKPGLLHRLKSLNLKNPVSIDNDDGK